MSMQYMAAKNRFEKDISLILTDVLSTIQGGFSKTLTKNHFCSELPKMDLQVGIYATNMIFNLNPLNPMTAYDKKICTHETRHI